MPFLVKADLYNYLDQSTIDQITDNTDSYVEEAILCAEDRIKEKISPRYDLQTEFAKTGTDRNRSLLKHCANLAIYYLFQRLYTDVIPEGRVEGMDMAESWLDEAYEGKIQLSLATNDEASEQGWSMRWGSKTKKGNQTY
ncbi:putative Head-Tail Connector Protein [uncultured Mediterranean phage uvMED]|nr:putative Head-Tail Connector Protein [uncultured Mediterranean phage uvMED]BAR22588.1 putative Head-Tail Connector Protein [uncultured Mediterranean phage uvMED]